MEMSYEREGTVSLPVLETLSDPSPTGAFALMRLEFLMRSKPVLYENLLTSGRLSSHLSEIQSLAEELVERTAPKIAEAEGASDRLRSTDPMTWADLMTAARASAVEMARRDLIEV